MTATGRTGLFRQLLLVAVATCLASVLSACGSSGSSPPSPSQEAGVALRYQADDGRQALLEINPFEIGKNTFRVTVMNSQSQPAAVNSVDLRFSRPDDGAPPATLPATPSDGGKSFVAESELQQTGWWDIDVVLDGAVAVNFYLRLDNPSQAPLSFAAPDYASDPAAEALFQKTLQSYQGLASVKEREELTSGLLAPTGTGAAVITDGELQSPDRLHFVTSSAGSSRNEESRVGTRLCNRNLTSNTAWQCQDAPAQSVLDISYLHGSTAFKLGRQQTVDGETTQLLLFYNPGQRAWFGWWVGTQTGYLRRQAMVAPGHFMLTHYFDHNDPVSIAIPPDAPPPSSTPQ